MLQSSYFDPVLGLDIHIVLLPTPAGPVPTPVPQPFVGMVFDPVGLAMGAAMGMALGGGPGLVLVNNLPVTNAGTAVTNLLTLPHLPVPGVAFAKGMPGNDAELFFGSLNVSLGGSLGVRLGDIAMSCSDPVRLPTSLVLAIPKGPPVLNTPSMVPDLEGIAQQLLMAAGMKALKAAARGGARLFRTLRAAQRKSHGWSRASGALRNVVDRIAPQRYRDRLKRAVCFVTGHPVDVATGRVFTDAVDFTLPGPLPLVFERVYSSSLSWRNGPLGHGWSHSLDQAVWVERGKVVYLAEDGREVEFSLHHLRDRIIRPGQEVFEVTNRLTLRALDGQCWEVESTEDGTVREFALVQGGSLQRAKLVRIRSRDQQHTIEFVYNERGLLKWVRDCGKRLIGFEHDLEGRLICVKLPLSQGHGWYRHRQYLYDSQGDLAEVVDAVGHSWRFLYDNHLLVQEIDRTGLSFYFQFDGQGAGARCVRTWGDGGIYDHQLTYDVRNRKTLVSNSLGHTTLYELDELGMVVKVTDPLGRTTRYEYDPDCGRRKKETNPLGQAFQTDHDARANVVRIAGPDQTELRIEYNTRNLPVRAVDALGGEWRWRYDAEGHMVERTTPTGELTRFHWTQGLLTYRLSPGGRRTEFVHDPSKNVVRTRAPNGAETRYAVDGLGRVIKTRDHRGGTTSTRYDAEGRSVEWTSSAEMPVRMTYDATGNLSELRSSTRQVRFRHGYFHKLIAREEADSELQFDYDTEGQLTAVINEAGERYSFEFDAAGHIVKEVGFDGHARHYLRDAAGRVTKTFFPSGRSSTATFDGAGRLAQVVHSDGTFAEFSYRQDGALLSAKNEYGEVLFERDGLGRILREAVEGAWITSGYGPDGERSRIETSLGGYASVERDVLGEVTALHLGQDEARKGRPPVRFERDLLGVELTRRFEGSIEVKWLRDLAGRPVERKILRHTAGAPIRELEAHTYRWRGEDQLAAIVDVNRRETLYDHDARGRLIGERSAGHEAHRKRDASGNVYRTHTGDSPHYGPGGRIEAADGTRYVYDEDGRRIQKLTPDGARWNYRWNGAGLLHEVQRPDGSRMRFEYDAFARRTKKKRVRVLDDGAEVVEAETRFVWDGHVVTHELSSESGLTTWYWEPETFTPVVKEHQGLRWSIATDHRGTPTEMYDEAGELSWRMNLDAFGGAHFEVGAAEDCPWRWPGQYKDEETGDCYNRWRYFDCDTGLYLSQDPLRLSPSPRLYAYPEDSLSWCDPLGLEACNIQASSRQDALDLAYERAGIPKGTKPDAVWEVGNDNMRRGHPGYLYKEDTGSHGRYMQFETEHGSRVISEHLNDGLPHFHSGQPKGDPTRNFVDFGWGGDSQTAERYGQVGGKHHIYYPEDI